MAIVQEISKDDHLNQMIQSNLGGLLKSKISVDDRLKNLLEAYLLHREPKLVGNKRSMTCFTTQIIANLHVRDSEDISIQDANERIKMTAEQMVELGDHSRLELSPESGTPVSAGPQFSIASFFHYTNVKPKDPSLAHCLDLKFKEKKRKFRELLLSKRSEKGKKSKKAKKN